jgi:hypothetical protein
VDTITEILDQALQEGYLTPRMEMEISALCQASILSETEARALDRIIDALISREIESVSTKLFVNVIEDLVFLESCRQLSSASGSALDVGDICAYSLNRLPPLYATTTKGAQYQREYALADLAEQIKNQVAAAISKLRQHPQGFVEGDSGLEKTEAVTSA